jgi:hypothetical protein
VKISRIWLRREKLFYSFIGIPAKNPVGIGCAKDISEIRLTDGAIQIKL